MEEGKNQAVYQTERRERKKADFYRLSCVWSNWTIIDYRAPFDQGLTRELLPHVDRPCALELIFYTEN